MNRDDELDSPLIAEIRRVRKAMLAEHSNDISALIAAMQRKGEEARLAGKTVVSLPPRRPQGWVGPSQKKAG